jgi:hypothetical protein
MGGIKYTMVPTTARALRVDFALFISPEYFGKETLVRTLQDKIGWDTPPLS